MLPLLIPAAASLTVGILQTVNENNKARRERQRLKRVNQRMKEFMANRQPVLNQADEYRALKDQLNNPYANLGVATQAAEMQMEQTDQALANTLDTIRSTGAGAGGATALAQAALQSKKEVAASIESQEAANEKLRAQGEEALESRQMAEKARIEGIQLQQAEKVQEAEVAGKQFVFQQKENREQQKIDRTAAELDNARMMAAQAQADQTSAFTGMLGGITDTLSKAYTPKKP